MVAALKVLNKCLAVEFYRQNAAFFGLLFLIFFGFIKASEHIAIASFLIANPATLFFLYIIWVAYGIKVMLFIIPTILKKENNFLRVFILFPFASKLKAAAALSISLLLPIIFYAIFLFTIAFSHDFYWAIVSLLLASSVMISTLSFILFKKLNISSIEKEFIHVPFLIKIARPPWLFFIEYLLRKELVLMILSKTYSCLVIIGTAALYHTDQFDLRVMSTGVLLSFAGSTSILHRYIWFIYQKMKFSLNLPIPYLKVFFFQLLTFTILLLPETIVLVRYYPLDFRFADISGIVLFGFSIALVIYSLLFLKQLELSEFIVRIFWLIVISTFLILFSIHPLLLAFLYVLIAGTILYFWRFRFEFVEKNR